MVIPMLMNLHAANGDTEGALSIGLLASALVAELGFARIGKENTSIRAREVDAAWWEEDSRRREDAHGVSSPHAVAQP